MRPEENFSWKNVESDEGWRGEGVSKCNELKLILAANLSKKDLILKRFFNGQCIKLRLTICILNISQIKSYLSKIFLIYLLDVFLHFLIQTSIIWMRTIFVLKCQDASAIFLFVIDLSKIQCAPLNGITLGQIKTDSNNRLMLISE